MSEILLFHHAQGLTPGVRAFADRLRADGHVVFTPDLYDGALFDDIDSGVAHAESLWFESIADRGVAEAEAHGPDLVYAGFSLGVLPAQRLAQTRPGARGALLYHAGIPLGVFGAWPDAVPVQLHVMADDPWGDVEDMRTLGATIPNAEYWEYPGSAHLFADPSLPDHDPAAAALLLERTLAFLRTIG